MTTNRAQTPPIETARSAKRSADAVRFEVISRLSDGDISIVELLDLALLLRPLNRVTLVRCMTAAGVGEATARSIADELIKETTNRKISRNRATVGWVTRVPARQRMFIDRCAVDRSKPPTRRFPFAG